MENDDPKIPQKLHVSGACLGMGVRLNGRTADATPSSCTSVKWGFDILSTWRRWHIFYTILNGKIIGIYRKIDLKQCHKQPMTGNGNHTTYKHCEIGDGLWHCFTNIINRSTWRCYTINSTCLYYIYMVYNQLYIFSIL